MAQATLEDLLGEFDIADEAYRQVVKENQVVDQAKSGFDGPMSMYQAERMCFADEKAPAATRGAAIEKLRDHFKGQREKLILLDAYVDIKSSDVVRQAARDELVA